MAGPPSTPRPAVERRLVSVLFADLVGFTAWSAGRDPEDVRELLSGWFALARSRIERHGGTVEKFIGDAVMAAWGARRDGLAADCVEQAATAGFVWALRQRNDEDDDLVGDQDRDDDHDVDLDDDQEDREVRADGLIVGVPTWSGSPRRVPRGR